MTQANVVITSPSNPTIKALAALRDRSGRTAAGRYLVEGTRELGRAIAAGVAFDDVAVWSQRLTAAEQEIVTHLVDSGAQALDMAEAPFRKVAYRENPGAVIGVARTTAHRLAALQLGVDALVLIVEGIEKPGNLGSMLRTAEAAGVDAVVIADPVVDPENPNVIRASQGAVFSVPLALDTIDETVPWAQGRGLSLVAGSGTAEDSYWQAPLEGAVGIVIGSEAGGLSEAWHDNVTAVRIPMAGAGDSLNAATAAALLLYEVLRRRSVR